MLQGLSVFVGLMVSKIIRPNSERYERILIKFCGLRDFALSKDEVITFRIFGGDDPDSFANF